MSALEEGPCSGGGLRAEGCPERSAWTIVFSLFLSIGVPVPVSHSPHHSLLSHCPLWPSPNGSLSCHIFVTSQGPPVACGCGLCVSHPESEHLGGARHCPALRCLCWGVWGQEGYQRMGAWIQEGKEPGQGGSVHVLSSHWVLCTFDHGQQTRLGWGAGGGPWTSYGSWRWHGVVFAAGGWGRKLTGMGPVRWERVLARIPCAGPLCVSVL